MKKYQYPTHIEITVTLAIMEARGPGIEYAVRVLRLELGHDDGIWAEEFTSEREADLFLCGALAALWMTGKGGCPFPTSVQQIINFGTECD